MRLLLVTAMAACLYAQAPGYEAGMAQYKAGKCREALVQFDASEKAAEPAPSRPFYQGVCLAREGEWAGAAARLAPYTAAHMGDSLAWYWLAQAQLYQKQFKEARTSIQRSIQLNDKSADSYRTLGQIELQLSDNDAAYRAWLTANRLNPLDAQTTYYLGRLFYEADVFNESAAWLRETLKLAPGHFAAMTYLAMCAERLNLQPTALELYQAAIRESKHQNKPFDWAFLNYAKLLRQLGRDAEAFAVLEEAEKLCPEAHILTLLGQMLAASHQPARAEQVLRRAISMDASIPDAHYRLALLLRTRGLAEEAQSELRKFQETKDAEERGKNRIQAVRKGE